MMPFQPLSTPPRTTSLYDVSEQQTLPDALLGKPEITTAADSELLPAPDTVNDIKKKPYRSQALAVILIVALLGSIFWLWRPTTALSPQDSVLPTASDTARNAQSATAASNADGGNIQVYITGAVKHPGVYTLDNQARVYQLLQAAGGPQPGANLTALNLATHLSDGQEIYVLHANETPVAGGSSGTTASNTPVTKVNVNTASADELRQNLQISTKSAQAIVTYRLQHGPFLSVDTLAQVVSKTVYAKIKDMVTVS
ncbi:helix-hairpin-helix domain-containing protein [Dictyobacter formicarum]|uniref:Competence protein n=1 Tax=Dictyobacter formicarum TaxID=2778368 RepID=A0ABQ3VW38_9CHLR|nr:ComEA family DNA-binding protein [Dictyobacter formicarum]GHO89899.1 competence protein [Dictyobacter formicarum]